MGLYESESGSLCLGLGCRRRQRQLQGATLALACHSNYIQSIGLGYEPLTPCASAFLQDQLIWEDEELTDETASQLHQYFLNDGSLCVVLNFCKGLYFGRSLAAPAKQKNRNRTDSIDLAQKRPVRILLAVSHSNQFTDPHINLAQKQHSTIMLTVSPAITLHTLSTILARKEQFKNPA